MCGVAACAVAKPAHTMVQRAHERGGGQKRMLLTKGLLLLRMCYRVCRYRAVGKVTSTHASGMSQAHTP